MHVDAPAAGGASEDASAEPEALHAVRVQRVVHDEDQEHWLVSAPSAGRWGERLIACGRSRPSSGG